MNDWSNISESTEENWKIIYNRIGENPEKKGERRR